MSETRSAIPTELGTEKIGKLLKQYALPAIIAQTASSLYNMVDSIFIGQGVGPLAISGLAVTFPLMNLSTAFGTLVGAGAATMLSVLLGQKNYKAANKVLGNVVSLNIIIGLAFMALSLIFIDPILYFFGASENTLQYAKEYIQIILYGNVITHLYFGLNAAMRSSGSPKKAMALTIFTVIFNTILDPIFIFVFDMGIAGAAWATVIAQAVSMIVVLQHFSNKTRPFHFEKGIASLDMRVAKDSLAIGMGPFLMHAAACLVTLFINQQLREYSGDLGIGAYGICNRFIFMFIMICTLIMALRGRFKALALHRNEIPLVVLLGLLYALSSVFMFQAFDYMATGLISTMYFVYPVMTASMMAMFFGERMSWGRILSLVMTIGGVLLLYVSDGDERMSLIGVGLTFAAALAYAVYIVITNQSRMRNASGSKVAFWSLMVGSVVFFARTGFGANLQVLPSLECWGLVLLLAIVPTVVSCTSLVLSIRYVGSTITSILGAMEPVTAVLCGTLVFGEAMSLRIFMGIFVIIAAVMVLVASDEMVARRRAKSRRKGVS